MSGFNVGIVCFICVACLKLLRIPRRVRIVVCVPFLVLYCLVTGASNPVVRATIMAVVFLSAYFVRREADIYNSCAFAALLILTAAPDELFNVGFQLSFASVLAIVSVYPRMRTLARVEKLGVRPLAFMADSCLVSISAWLGTAGIIAYNFRMVSPVTVLANLFIVPLATLITVSSVSLIIAEFISPYLALSFAPAVEFLVHLLLRVNAFFFQMPHAYFYLGVSAQG